ncbi:delta-1-pyrroline-5-carboxylate dehydrogenase, partial [Bacillus cereus G9241]
MRQMLIQQKQSTFMEYYGRQMLKLKDGIPVESRPIEYN